MISTTSETSEIKKCGLPTMLITSDLHIVINASIGFALFWKYIFLSIIFYFVPTIIT